MNCSAIIENPPSWVIKEKFVEQPHTDSTSRQATVILEDLSPFTHYKCYAYVKNEAGTSEASEPIEFSTLEDGEIKILGKQSKLTSNVLVPSKPLNLKSEEDEDGILVTWEEPAVIPGTQENYAVTLEPRNFLHYVPEECDISVEPVLNQTSDLQYRFKEILPNYAYTVYVAASTSAGFGEAESLYFNTLFKSSLWM